MRCQKCGTLNASSSKFCYSCGSELPLANSVPGAHDGMVKEDAILSEPQENEPAMAKHTAVSLTQNKKSAKRGLSLGVRFFLAVLACLGIYMIYVIIAVVLDWKPGDDGIIPMAITVACMGAAWRAIFREKK